MLKLRFRYSFFLIIILFVSCSEAGRTYQSYKQFINDQQELGFVFLDKFGDSWPAEITKIETAMNKISFIYNGVRYRYPGYTGYKLKVVRLITDNGEVNVIVLRSEEKE
ncbi:MAG: hypothetical protein PVH88_24340 [Ignavibacteria bacterium]|jgi:hypothetical protein